MSSNPNPYKALADAVQVLEDASGYGRDLKITLTLVPEGYEDGNPDVDYVVEERPIGGEYQHIASACGCESVEEALVEIAQALEA